MKTYRYEILDDMEAIVALADCLEDAIHAARKHEAKLIWDAKIGRTVQFRD